MYLSVSIRQQSRSLMTKEGVTDMKTKYSILSDRLNYLPNPFVFCVGDLSRL
jgi:hypothetical protein